MHIMTIAENREDSSKELKWRSKWEMYVIYTRRPVLNLIFNEWFVIFMVDCVLNEYIKVSNGINHTCSLIRY